MIGNAAYGAEIGPLQNPVNDATDMAATLQQLGFEVIVLLDATRQQMEDGIAAFRRQLRPGGVGLFYFAGHGAQVEGTNYLIPLGANVESAMTAKADALSAEQVLASMVEAGTALNFIILDACRNNPFTPRWPVGRPGLAPMQAARGSLIAYATAPGAVAVDGSGPQWHVHQTSPAAPDRTGSPRRADVQAGPCGGGGRDQGGTDPVGVILPAGGFYLSSYCGSSPRHGGGSGTAAPGAGWNAGGWAGGSAALRASVSRSWRRRSLARMAPRWSWCRRESLSWGSPRTRSPVYCANPKAKSALLKDETPSHRVFLDPFYIDTYEVTNARFQQFVQATGYRTQAEREGGGKIRTGAKTWAQVPDANWRAPRGQGSSIAGLEAHPVVQVSWHDAKAYCAWAGKRLPTEAEWEKAARGTDGRLYPWGNQSDGSRVNFCDRNCPFEWKDDSVDDGYGSTAPVGSYEAGRSPYGTYDMAGNVWEWVADRYDAGYYQRSPARNPPGPSSGAQVGLRGGSWLYDALAFRTTVRSGVPPDRRNDNIGLRCVRAP